MPSSTNRLTGIFPPVVTPFSEDKPDLRALRSNLMKLSGKRIAGFLGLGSNGEFRSLSEKETEQVMEVFGDEKGEKVLIIGVGAESTEITIRNCRIAAAHGADYASVITPSYFAKLMNDGVMLRHYRAVAEASPIPITIYNIPGSTGGVQVSPAVVKQLAEHPNIAGMKDSSPVGPGRFLSALAPEVDFHVLAGSINTFYPSLCLGARGGVLSLANVIPDECDELYRLTAAGNHAEARALHGKLMRLNQAVSGRYGVAGVKAAMSLAGYTGGAPRLPLVPLETEEAEALAAEFADAGFPLA